MYSLRGAAILLAVASLQLVLAWPQRPQYAKIVERQEIQDEYDYIIIGGGTSGLTVGDRLTENGKCMQRKHERFKRSLLMFA